MMISPLLLIQSLESKQSAKSKLNDIIYEANILTEIIFEKLKFVLGNSHWKFCHLCVWDTDTVEIVEKMFKSVLVGTCF